MSKWIETESNQWINSSHIESLVVAKVKTDLWAVRACTRNDDFYTIATYATEAQARECVNSLISQIADGKSYTIRATIE
jgi:hypothetical protein